MSVLGQGYPNLEYFIIDGGSKDGSADIIRKYEKQLTYWHSKPDQGQADAINQGLQMATGDLCAYINSDDKLVEGSLWKMAYLARQFPSCDVFFGANHILFQDGGVMYMCPRPWLPGSGLGALQDGTFWRKLVHDKIGYYETSFQFSMCCDFFTRTLLQHRTLFHSEPMSIIRHHPLSKTSTMGDVSRKEMFRLHEQYKDARFPLSWRSRAKMVQWVAGATSKMGRYLFKPMWRIQMPPLQITYPTTETSRS
jgi:hypothetical protein